MKLLYKTLPWLFVALFGAEIIAVFFVPKNDKPAELHLREFGRLPVLMNGRVQPMDSVGRNTLLQIRNTGDVPLEEVPSWKFWHHPKKLRSSEWLAEVLFNPEVADTRPIFLIHHPELLSELNLQDKGKERSGLRYYTFDELKPVLREIHQQASNAPNEDKVRTPLQKQVVKLYNAVFIYQTMKGAARPTFWDDFKTDLASYESVIEPGLAAMRAREAKMEHDEKVLAEFWGPVTEFFQMARDGNAGQRYPLVIPPYTREQKHEDWSSMGQALLDSVRNRAVPAPVKSYAAMASAYAQSDVPAFNAAVSEYKGWLASDFIKEVRKAGQEFFFNQTKSFLHAMIIYLAAFILAAGALLTLAVTPGFAESLRKSALYLLLIAGAVHTFGLVFRMYLEARPPVTNLYSSAVFIGWGAMVLGIILERVYRLGLGVAVAALTGFVTLIIAHNLGMGGDTMEMMRAVLDSNFWLATHVVTITIGYSGTFVAGVLGMAFIVLGLFTPILAQKVGKANLSKALGNMVYGIIAFSTFFSFVGTVLGGIWADQSWGRFWGWDPKENGALIIVLWNALILHARWGRIIGERGLMNLAIFGNVVTAFSWFGVNMLGIGLHSYGFMDAAFKWLVLFTGSQVAFILLGSLPLRMWQSFRSPEQKPPPAPPLPGESAAAPA